MKPGDMVRIHVPGSSHPGDDYLHGMLVLIIGEPITTKHTYIKCLCDKVRMIPARWLESIP